MVKKDDEIKNLKLKIEELENNWKRALADYQNLEKRTAKEKGEYVQIASQDLVLKLLPILDQLKKAQEHLKDEGLNLVLNNFEKVFEDEGLVKIDVLGKEFNPEEMECVDVTQGKQENKVVEEVSAGYKLRGKVIKVAQVKVVKKEMDQKAEGLAKEELKKGNYM